MSTSRIEIFKQMLVSDPINSSILFGLAKEYEKAGQTEEMIETLERYLSVLERAVGRQAQIERTEAHPSEMIDTVANIDETRRVLGWQPTTTIDEGLPKFVDWYRRYHGL